MTTPLQFETRNECPACGLSDYEEVVRGSHSSPELQEYSRLFYGDEVDFSAVSHDEYHLVKCAACGTYFQVQVLAPEGMEVLYENWIDPDASYRKINSNYNQNPLGSTNQVLGVRSLIAKKPTDTWILDFGCGWGAFLQASQAMGYNVIGVELSPSRLAFLKSRGITCYENANEASRKFDFVNCSQVLEHVSNPLEILIAIKAVCAPGAIVHISTPDSSRLPKSIQLSDFVTNGKVNQQFGSVMPPLEHINGYSPNSLITLASRAGLTFVRRPSSEVVQIRGNMFGVAYRIARAYGKQLAYRLNPKRTTDLYFTA